MPRKLRVGIIGGGIGGVALAGCLLQRGFEVKIFERASGFGEVGAGIQMTPNAVKVMRELGLMDKLSAAGFLPNALVGRNWRTGREIFRTPLKDACMAAYGAPFIHIHRQDLHSILASLVPDSVPSFSTSCTGVRQDSGSATALFADGSAFEADVIVGADGVRSVVRAELFGAEDPKFTGHMCYRAVVPVPGVVDFVSPDGAFWFGPHGHVVTYYVRGGKAVNIVAVAESDKWVEESWNVRSSKEEMLQHYKGWHRNVATLFERVDEAFKWGLFDRDPMTTWSKERITLLGDAAHPMLPFLSQGAAMAIEDSYVLAAALDAHGSNIGAAFRDYENERLPRTSRVQLQARERGKTYHLPSRWAQARRDFIYWVRGLINPQTTGLGANWVYDYDATAFRPSAAAAKDELKVA